MSQSVSSEAVFLIMLYGWSGHICPLDPQGHGQNVLYSCCEVAFISLFYGCHSRLQLEILRKCSEINFDRS
jgi:hypothetical protein